MTDDATLVVGDVEIRAKRRKRMTIMQAPYFLMHVNTLSNLDDAPKGTFAVLNFLLQRTNLNADRVSKPHTARAIAAELGISKPQMDRITRFLRDNEIVEYHAKGRKWLWDCRHVSRGDPQV